MNKELFIKELSEKLDYSEEKCVIVNDILENNFVISKKSKEPIVAELMTKLDIENDEANRVYDIAVEAIKKGVKESLKHPFRNKD